MVRFGTNGCLPVCAFRKRIPVSGVPPNVWRVTDQRDRRRFFSEGVPVHAYRVKIVADALMMGVPWLLLAVSQNERVLCIKESVMGRPPEERLSLLSGVLEGCELLLPAQRDPSN